MKVILISDEKLLRSDDQNLPTAFEAAGHQVEVVDWRQLDGKKTQADFALIRTPWDYASKPKEFLQLLNDLKNNNCKVVHDPGLVQWNMDKKYLSDFYIQGYPVVPTYMIEKFELAKLKEADSKLPSRFVVKPRIGASGKDTFLVSKNEDFTQKLQPLIGIDVLVQPFVASIQTEGEYSFLYFKEQFSHAVVKTAQKGEFRIQEMHGGRVQAYTPTQSELITVTELLTDLKLDTIYARVDVVRVDGQFQLMELEVIEPELFFRFGDSAEQKLAQALIEC